MRETDCTEVFIVAVEEPAVVKAVPGLRLCPLFLATPIHSHCFLRKLPALTLVKDMKSPLILFILCFDNQECPFYPKRPLLISIVSKVPWMNHAT